MIRCQNFSQTLIARRFHDTDPGLIALALLETAEDALIDVGGEEIAAATLIKVAGSLVE